MTPTPQRLALLKASGRSQPNPVTIRAILDTGASMSAIDSVVLRGLDLLPTGSSTVPTPSSGAHGETRDEFDVRLAFGVGLPGSKSYVVSVIGANFALTGHGSLGLIGWDVLAHCVLNGDGPAKTFEFRF